MHLSYRATFVQSIGLGSLELPFQAKTQASSVIAANGAIARLTCYSQTKKRANGIAGPLLIGNPDSDQYGLRLG